MGGGGARPLPRVVFAAVESDGLWPVIKLC